MSTLPGGKGGNNDKNNSNRPRSDSTSSTMSWSSIVSSGPAQKPSSIPSSAKSVSMDTPDFGEFRRRGEAIQAITWNGWRVKETSDERRMKAFLTDSFHNMESEFAAEEKALQDEFGPGARCPETVSIIWVPEPCKKETGKWFIASGVKNTKTMPDMRPKSGPTAALHPRFAKAIILLEAGGPVYHRTNFCCSEMHAVNMMLKRINPAKNADFVIPVGIKIITFGYPEYEGIKAFMWPCERDDGMVGRYRCQGCKNVLQSIGSISFSGEAKPDN